MYERLFRILCGMSIVQNVNKRLRRDSAAVTAATATAMGATTATVQPFERLLARTSVFKLAIKRLCN